MLLSFPEWWRQLPSEMEVPIFIPTFARVNVPGRKTDRVS
jgi:hypothetical protein